MCDKNLVIIQIRDFLVVFAILALLSGFLKIGLIPINSYFLVRKNVEKWGYIEMGFGSNLGVRFGSPIWESNLRVRLESQIWESDLNRCARWLYFPLLSSHETIIWTGTTCKKIPYYMRESACRWFIVKKAKIFWSYIKHVWILAGVRKCRILIGLCK